MLRSELKTTETKAIRVLRQREQIILASLVAILLVIISIGGTLIARYADAEARVSEQRVALTHVVEAKLHKQAEFLGIVRQHLDGGHVAVGASRVDPAAVSAARGADLTLFMMSDDGRILSPDSGVRSDNGLRLGGGGSPSDARSLAELALEYSGSQSFERSANYLLTYGEVTGYVFVEPVHIQPVSASRRSVVAIAVWPLDQAYLAQLFAEHGLQDVRLSNEPLTDFNRAGFHLGAEEGAQGVYLSWHRPAAMKSLWHQILPLVSFALVGILLMILNSHRFGREAASLVHEIETSAYDRATRDPLTGLHNRSGFKMRLDDALEGDNSGALVGVIYIDLDRFKEVNDGFGHETGDKLLIAVTERLTQVCGRDVTIARLGGDEFAVVVTKRDGADIIVKMGEAISRELGLPFQLGSTEVVIGGSVGIAVFPEDGNDATELVRRADISMYRAKTGGRGQAIRFHSSMEDEVKRRKFLEGELRHAIARNELEVWYQPYMASDGESLVGVEALLRWIHPTEGVISPAIFVPLAEETGQIVEIGEWAMRRAMQDAMRWPGVHLAINVSPVQFRRKELVANTVAMIEEIGIERDRIEIEITEGVLMEDAEAAIEVIQGFRDERLHVALDDFGTGYASLSYLRRFPFDKLKVDQAFVRNLGVTPGSAAIIHSVVALGRSLGMTVHAEGVETLEHHIFLRAAGCHHFQGYYFSKPMNREATDAFIASKSLSTRYAMRA